MKYQTTENVQSIPIKEIQPFHNHPFTVADNEDMAKIVESIGKVGTITPLLARPLPDGGYELISGHRRLEACRKLGLENIPVIVREMTDDGSQKANKKKIGKGDILTFSPECGRDTR